MSTAWVLQQGDTVRGLTDNGPTLKGNANNIALIESPGVHGTQVGTGNIRISNIRLDANGKSGINGINMNMSQAENSIQNHYDHIHFIGNFQFTLILDGAEDSTVSYLYQSGTGDISGKVWAGEIIWDHIIMIGFTLAPCMRVFGWTVITESIINCVIEEHDFGVPPGGGPDTKHLASTQLVIENSYLLNRNANNDKGNASRILNHTGYGDNVTINTVYLINDGISMGNNGALFMSSGPGTSLTIYNLVISGCIFTNFNSLYPGTNSYWVKDWNGGLVSIRNLSWQRSSNSSGILPGDAVTTPFGTNYYFTPEQAGFAQTAVGFSGSTPPLPGGTGSANAKYDFWPWPQIINMNITTSAGVVQKTGIHVISISGTDIALVGNPSQIALFPGERIYFATFIPYAWQWYGDQW